MKKFVCLLVIVGVLGFFAFTPAEAGWGGRWVLYDDFNYADGPPDSSLWQIISPDPNDTRVESGQLRITHDWSANVNNGVRFKVNPERLKAVKMRVMVESIAGNLQARIGGYIGEEQDGSRIFKRVAVRRDGNGMDRLDCWEGEDTYDRHFTEFINTGRTEFFIVGEWFEIGMNFNRWISKCWVKDFRKEIFSSAHHYYHQHQTMLGSGT